MLRYFKYRTAMAVVVISVVFVCEGVYAVRCNGETETAGSFAEAQAVMAEFHRNYVGNSFELIK